MRYRICFIVVKNCARSKAHPLRVFSFLGQLQQVLLPLPPVSASWATRRLLIRGTYSLMSVKLYGTLLSKANVTMADAASVQAAAAQVKQRVLQTPMPAMTRSKNT